MAAIFALLTLACLVLFIIGLISPKIALFFMAPEKRTRGKSALIYFCGFIASGLICSAVTPPKELTAEEKQAIEQQEAEAKALAETKVKEEQEKKAAEERAQKIKNFDEKYKDFTLGQYAVNTYNPKFVEDFININPDLNMEDKDKFQKCFSEYAYTKAKDVKAIDAIGWCKNERLNNQEAFNNHIDLDVFFIKFDPWNGAFRPLEKVIKENMNDPKSYEHANTYYRLNLQDKTKPSAIVTTEFRGKNAFGAVVKNAIQIEYNILDGTFKVLKQ